MPASPLRAVGPAAAASEGQSPNSRGAHLLRLAQQRDEEPARSSARFALSAGQQEAAAKLALLDARRSLFAAPASPVSGPPPSPRRRTAASPQSSPLGKAAASAPPPPPPRLPEECETLAEDFAAVEVLAALAAQRGEARWLSDLTRGAAAIRGGLGPGTETLERVEGVQPGVWRWAWERRDEHALPQLRLLEGPSAAELAPRLAAFRATLERLVRVQHAAWLAGCGDAEQMAAARAGFHPAFRMEWPRGALPLRPELAGVGAASAAARLGVAESSSLAAEEEAVATQEVPPELAHLPAHLVAEARRRQEAARRLAAPSPRARLLGRLPGLLEDLRALCVVNRRRRWDLELLCAKLAPGAPPRAAERAQMRAQLEELARLTDGFCRVFENTHADGGTFVRVEKKGFGEALAKLNAAIAVENQ